MMMEDAHINVKVNLHDLMYVIVIFKIVANQKTHVVTGRYK